MIKGLVRLLHKSLTLGTPPKPVYDAVSPPVIRRFTLYHGKNAGERDVYSIRLY
jgi:hypothetical protein